MNGMHTSRTNMYTMVQIRVVIVAKLRRLHIGRDPRMMVTIVRETRKYYLEV